MKSSTKTVFNFGSVTGSSRLESATRDVIDGFWRHCRRTSLPMKPLEPARMTFMIAVWVGRENVRFCSASLLLVILGDEIGFIARFTLVVPMEAVTLILGTKLYFIHFDTHSLSSSCSPSLSPSSPVSILVFHTIPSPPPRTCS